ncbi:MAG: hypothetical protein INH41_30780 [Myxococcaceae bacterium]|jgi:hypothetical protein|nr:hypothetical protein [Myxococcaceae bacterium]
MKTERTSSTSPLTCQPPPTPEGPTGPQRASRVSSTLVEAERPKTTLAAVVDFRPGRQALSDALTQLEPHTAAELLFKGEVKGGDAVKSEFKARVERRDDGTFEVSAENLAALGVGLKQGAAFGGLSGGGTLVFTTADEAADFIHAVATSVGLLAARSSLPVTAAVVDGVMGLSRDAAERIARGSDRVEVLRLGSQVELEGELAARSSPFGEKAEAKAAVSTGTQHEVDFSKARLTTRHKLEGKLEGELGLKLGDTLAARALANRFNGKGELKASVALEERRTLTPGTLEQLRRGELSPAQLAKAVLQAPTEYVAVVKLEGEVRQNGLITGMGRLEASTEVVLDRRLAEALLSGQTSPLGELVNAKWEGKVEAALGGHQEIDLEVAKVETGATRWVTRKFEDVSIADLARDGARWLDDRQALEAQLSAQRRTPGD